MAAIAPTTEQAVASIVNFGWRNLSEAEMISATWAYYFFSVQFRENLELATEFFPEDNNLRKLLGEESDTDNLSPYPGIAVPRERLDHDAFMRRALDLAPVTAAQRHDYEQAGARYLARVRDIEPITRALSISSYEDGGLEQLFIAMLTAPDHDHPTLRAFRYFMVQHIAFDSDPAQGHGQLSRQLPPSEDVVELWVAFQNILLELTPRLALVLA